jgi:hypothetical protein
MTNPSAAMTRFQELRHRKRYRRTLEAADLINRLRDEFTHIVAQTEGNSAMGLTDHNKIAENLICGLMKEQPSKNFRTPYLDGARARRSVTSWTATTSSVPTALRLRHQIRACSLVTKSTWSILPSSTSSRYRRASPAILRTLLASSSIAKCSYAM